MLLGVQKINKYLPNMNISSAVDARFSQCYSTAHRCNKSTINALELSLWCLILYKMSQVVNTLPRNLTNEDPPAVLLKAVCVLSLFVLFFWQNFDIKPFSCDKNSTELADGQHSQPGDFVVYGNMLKLLSLSKCPGAKCWLMFSFVIKIS